MRTTSRRRRVLVQRAATTTLEAMIAVQVKDPKKKGDAVVLKALLQKVK